jgi:AcrR family transcriptional regulator
MSRTPSELASGTASTAAPTATSGTASTATSSTVPGTSDVVGPEGARRRKRNPRGRGDRLRVDLLDAAAELMAEKGDVDAISLRAVAARAGVSPTAVYRHFDDHLDLLRAAVVHCWSGFDDAMTAAESDALDPYERFDAMGRAYVEFAMTEPGKYHVLFSNKIDVDMGGRSVGETTFERLVGAVDAILTDRSDARDARFVAVQVHTWIHGIVDLIGRHQNLDWPSVDALVDDLAVRLGLTPTD